MTSLRTPFADRLGIDLPIFGFTHSTEVSAAITAAGGLGVYGVAHDPPEALPAKLADLRARTGPGPTAVDLIMPDGMPEGQTLEEIRAGLPEEHWAFVNDLAERYGVPPATRKTFFNSVLRTPAYFEGQLDAIVDSDVELVAFGVGLTNEAVVRLKEAGKVVGALVGSPRHVDRYLDVGLDFLVAQGSEAGGHTGTIGTMVLVPEVVQRAQGLPVLAAGGIGHGSQLAASLAMGAQGVWLGTAWLGTEEHSRGDHAVTDRLRQKLFAAGSGDTAVTRGSSGKPQRQIRTKWIDEWAADDAPAPLKMPFQHALVGNLMTAIDEHQVDPLLNTPTGQGVAWMTETRPVAQVVEDIAAQAEQAINSLVSDT